MNTTSKIIIINSNIAIQIINITIIIHVVRSNKMTTI